MYTRRARRPPPTAWHSGRPSEAAPGAGPASRGRGGHGLPCTTPEAGAWGPGARAPAWEAGTLEACPPPGIAQRGMQKLAPPEEGQEAAEVHVEVKPPVVEGAAAKEAKEEL